MRDLMRDLGRVRLAGRGGGRAAARMVLPTRLRSKVLTELSALDLRSALSELKSYREPPEAVRLVLVGVLCLLGRRRPDLTDWRRGVQPHLKPSLLGEMKAFDATKDGAERAWAESRAATEGLTSDDVHRKGSLAVQAMLRWLEVARLTRNSGAVEKLEGELELQRVQESRG